MIHELVTKLYERFSPVNPSPDIPGDMDHVMVAMQEKLESTVGELQFHNITSEVQDCRISILQNWISYSVKSITFSSSK